MKIFFYFSSFYYKYIVIQLVIQSIAIKSYKKADLISFQKSKKSLFLEKFRIRIGKNSENSHWEFHITKTKSNMAILFSKMARRGVIG